MHLSSLFALFSDVHVAFPEDANTNILMFLRWVHFLAGILWVGLLYFFNLVNVPFMKELDPATKGRVIPTLMPRALWWFRWASVVTVLAGLWYWMIIVGSDKRNALAAGYENASGGPAIGSFFGLWTLAFIIYMGVLMSPVDALKKGPILAIITAIIILAAAWEFLQINSHGWESNRLLAIGIGGGMGWFMMLNVWGVIWRAQKKIIRWTAQNVADKTPIPVESAKLARQVFLASRTNAYLSVPLLFFMAAASHYPMFGK